MTYITELRCQDKKDETPTPNEETEEDPVYDQAPVRVVCPRCGLNSITFIEHEASWVTYAVCIGLLLVLGPIALLVVPIVYPLFKDVVHHCPRCLSTLASKSRVVLPNPRDEVMSFRFGSCVMVLARKYVVMLCGLCFLIGGIHFVRTTGAPATGLDAIVRSQMMKSSLTWGDFSRECGFKSYLGNPIHVSTAFDAKFKNRTVHWEGEVHHIEEGLSFLWFNARGALYLRMSPPQFPQRREMADLVLSYNEADKTIPAVLATLKRGTNVSFDATAVEVGKRGKPHIMVLWELVKIGNRSPVVQDADNGEKKKP